MFIQHVLKNLFLNIGNTFLTHHEISAQNVKCNLLERILFLVSFQKKGISFEEFLSFTFNEQMKSDKLDSD
jgi:hypothetical protein